MIGRSHDAIESRPESESYTEWVQRWNEGAFSDSRQWFRFWMWEALDKGERNITREKDRVEVFQNSVEEIRQAQARGEIDPSWDPELLTLAMTAVLTFPHVLPQLTKLIVGVSHDDEEFSRRQSAFLAQLVDHLAAPASARSRRTSATKPAVAGSPRKPGRRRSQQHS
jgi:hypothetical protein